MKTLLFTCLFLFPSIVAFSQDTCSEIQFRYDVSGNRIQRDFNKNGPCPSYPTVIKPVDSTLTITTYPNPTTGLLNIDITSKDPDCSEPTLVSIYDINAQPVFSGSTSQSKLQLDVSSLSQGTYIVKVNNCNYQSSSVVLKTSNNSTIPNQSVKRVIEVKY